MESISCNLCGSREHVLVRDCCDQRCKSKVPFSLVKCRQCELVYLNPRPSEREILTYYPPAYQAAIRQLLQKVRQSRIGLIGLQIMRKLRKPPLSKVGKILDIGCSGGDYLAYLRTLGWEVYGIELDKDAVRHAREHFGLNVHLGTAEHTLNNFQNESFDVITMWHVLEHMFDPSLVLAQVYRLLKPGGILMLEMPNFNSLWATVLGRDWFPLEIPRHLYHFTPLTLTAILNKTGFNLKKFVGVPAPIEIIWSLRVLWNRLKHTPEDWQLVWNSTSVVLLYPVEWLLACFKRSTFMQAVVVKPFPVKS